MWVSKLTCNRDSKARSVATTADKKEKKSSLASEGKKKRPKIGKKKKRNQPIEEPKSSVVGMPMKVVHKVHIDKDYNWSGQDPDEVFELKEKLGEG